ncbi:MAG: hypothetical protein JWP97_4020 [Labilithrix sp.]|nr:hypothetical protein [Labilithrix sp.]
MRFPVRLPVLAAATLTALVMLGGARPAGAFTYGSAISVGCHERITTATLRGVRTQLPTRAVTISPSKEEKAFIEDVPFGVEPDLQELAGATLLVAVRDNDLKGNSPTEVDELANVHGNPDNQEEHCLRAGSDDEPDGNAKAVDKCRGFIRAKVVEALDGLDAQGAVDPGKRTDLDVSLSLRGKVSASLPLYWVRIGQAMHTLQDSFAHTFRSPDRMKVRTVLNYIEYVKGNEVESRDGPLHRTGLDACDGLDDLRTANIGMAQQASMELLRSTLDPALATREAKLAAVDALLVKYLSLDPGCTSENHWCDAPELRYEVAQSCGCRTAGRGPGGWLAAAAGAAGLAIFAARRRRTMRRGAKAAALSALLLGLALPATARAQAVDTNDPALKPATPAGSAQPKAPAQVAVDPATGAAVASDQGEAPAGVPTVSQAKSEQNEQEHNNRLFGVYAAVSGSVTDPAVNGQLGVRLRVSELFSLGLDAELNNWFALQTSRLRTGAFNAYLTGIVHYPIRFAAVNLRSTLNLGTSTLLIDLYGAPKGSTGIYVGAVPLGLEWKLSSRLYLVWDALGIALPVPQLKGAPYAYPQYRTAVGLELSF